MPRSLMVRRTLGGIVAVIATFGAIFAQGPVKK